MKSVSPVLPDDATATEYVLGHGEPFGAMHVVRFNEAGVFLARFELTDQDLCRVMETGEVYVLLHSRNRKLLPVKLLAERPEIPPPDPGYEG